MAGLAFSDWGPVGWLIMQVGLGLAYQYFCVADSHKKSSTMFTLTYVCYVTNTLSGAIRLPNGTVVSRLSPRTAPGCWEQVCG